MIKQRDWGNSCGGELWHFYTLHLRHQNPSLPPSLTHPPPPRMLLYQHRRGRRGGRQKLSETGTRGEALLWHDARYQRRHPRLVMQRSYLLLVYTCTEPTRSEKKTSVRIDFLFQMHPPAHLWIQNQSCNDWSISCQLPNQSPTNLGHFQEKKNEIFSGFFPDLWQ